MRPSVSDLWFFARMFRGSGWTLLGALGLGVMTALGALGLLGLSGGFLTATALAGLSVATAETFDIVIAPGAIRVFALMRTVGRWAERMVGHSATFGLLAALRLWLYQSLIPLTPRQVGSLHSAEVLSRFTKDIDALEHLVLRIFLPGTTALLSFTAVLILGGVLAPAWALGLGLAALVCLVGIPWISLRISQASAARLAVHQGRLRTGILEILQHLEDLSLHQAAREHLKTHTLTIESLRRQDQEILGRRTILLRSLVPLTLGLAALGTLGILTLVPSLDGPWKVALVLLTLGLTEVALPLPQAATETGFAAQAAHRLRSLATQTPGLSFPGEFPGPEPQTWDLEVQNLGFSYQAGTPVLSGVNFTLPQGTHLALAGPSGGGKSTLAKLLARLEDPTEGRILLGGMDLKAWPEGALRSQITLVPQDPWIFRRPLRDNLTLGRPGISEETLWTALENLNLAEEIRRLPQGLDTWAQETGFNFSGGQRRRLGLARALLVPSPILILDEPTEGLDEEAARSLLERLRSLHAGRTLIWITHRTGELSLFPRVQSLGV